MPDATIQSKIGVNDCIAFESQYGIRLGMVIDESSEDVEVLIFEKVTSDISKQHALQPVAAAVIPWHTMDICRRWLVKLQIPYLFPDDQLWI